MTPELNPCFYYISVRGFDRLLIISTILFGGFYHIANQVIYRVFHVIGHQEQGCCEHVLCLMNALRGSM